MTLELKPHGGEDIADVCRNLQRIANMLQITVWCKHNDVQLIANKDSSYQSVMAQWTRSRQGGDLCK